MKVTNFGQNTLLVSNASSAPAGGVTVADPGGFFGSPDTLTVEEILALIGAGLSPGAFLTVIEGGKGTVQALGTFGAGPVIIDLANGNKFWGTADQNVTISTTGWTNLKDCQISVEILQDGSGGSTPTFSGVTWIGGTPTWDTTASSVTHVVLFSRDGGTTIYGAIVGAGGSSDLDAIITASSGQDIADALAGADSPEASNVFATMADVAAAIGSGAELDYSQITSDVTVSGTAETSAGSTLVITGNAAAYDGAPVVLEVFAPAWEPGLTSGDDIRLLLFESTTMLGRLGLSQQTVNGGNGDAKPLYARYRFTPTAASHTYLIRAMRSNADGTIRAGAAGSAYVPAFLRITKA